MTTTWTQDRPPAALTSARRGRGWLLTGGVLGTVVLLLAAAVVLDRQSPPPPVVVTPLQPGPVPHVAGGVLVGYPHTEAGARSAAVNYIVAIGGPAMFVPGQRHAMFAAIADPARLDAAQAKYDAGIPQIESRFGLDGNGAPSQAGLTFTCRTLPVGVRTDGYSPDTALVSVWASSLIGLAGQGSTLPVTERWATETVTVRWAAGDWKYVSDAGQLGPVPVVGVQAPSDSVEVAIAARTFGGLTYAG